jgi:hypothetical protein
MATSPRALRARVARYRAALLLTVAGPVALGGAGVAACYGRGRNAPPEAEVTTIRVRNQSFLDHNIYVIYGGGARARLGNVNGNSTAVLRIPPSFIQPGGLLRFLADPIGSNLTPVSDQIIVSPGDEVQLTIPPR